MTAHHWVRRHVINGCPKCTVLWIDEISQIDVGLLLQICKLTFSSNIRFLLSGDFNQFSPIGNNFRGTPVSEDALQSSNLLHTMASGNCVMLLECRRSDSELFDFYASLIVGGSRFETPLKNVVCEARAAFNFGDQPPEAHPAEQAAERTSGSSVRSEPADRWTGPARQLLPDNADLAWDRAPGTPLSAAASATAASTP